MPWEARSTDLQCMHCLARGFDNVTLVHETYYYDTDRFRWVDGPEGRSKTTVPGRGYKTMKNDNGSVSLLARLKCPHWPCKHNNSIRARNKTMRRQNRRASGRNFGKQEVDE